MSREEIEKLLGGYATGTLTPEERDALFAAALEDQQLFEALAREEPLRELLQDPLAKTRLLAALERKSAPGYWRWLRPAAWAIPAVGLAAITVLFVVQRLHPSRPVMVAQAPALARRGPVAPVPSPVPQALEPLRSARLIEARPAPPPATPPKDAPSQAQTPAVLTDQVLIAAAPQPPPPPLAAPALPPPPPPAPAAPPPADKEADSVKVGAATPQLLVQAGAAQQTLPVLPQGQQRQQGQQNGVRLRAETAAVTGQIGGAAGSLPAQDARALFFGQGNAVLAQTYLVESEQLKRKAAAPVAPAIRRETAPPVAPQLAVRYSILRRLANGQFAAVIPNEVLDPVDRFVVKLESNDSGSLSVFERGPEGWGLLASSMIGRLAPYQLPASGALTFDGAATKDWFVVFSRQPQPTPYPVPAARLDQVLNVNLAERFTYAASTAPNPEAQIVAFPITLAHK